MMPCNLMDEDSIGRFRYIAWVKCPYKVAGKASAFHARKLLQVECPYRVAGEASALGRGKRYTEIGILCWMMWRACYSRVPTATKASKCSGCG